MITLVKRDLLAIPWFMYIFFGLFTLVFVLVSSSVLMPSIATTLLIWATFLTTEGHNHVPKFIASLPISRADIVLARYVSTLIVFIFVYLFAYLVARGWFLVNNEAYLPTGENIWLGICLAIILLAVCLPYSYLIRSHQVALAVVALHCILLLVLTMELLVTFTLSQHIQYDTGSADLLFIYERGPWEAELFQFIAYYLPKFPAGILTAVALAVVAGSIWLSARTYKRRELA